LLEDLFIPFSLVDDCFCYFVSCRMEPGFLKLFNGHWGIEPWIQEGKPVGSNVFVSQEVLPSILPPGPLGDT
jgi:hypothetical protein